MDKDAEEPWIEDVDEEVKSKEDDDEEQPLPGFDLFSIDKKEPVDEFKLTLGDITIDLNGIKAKYPHLLQSTGMTLWEGSEKLCEYLCEHKEIVQGKTIVELGAGLGLCGIVAHKHGASRVILTDGDTDTLRNMRMNISSNIGDDAGDSLLCKQLLWGKRVEQFREMWEPDGFDIVMGGDIAYAQESLEILFETAMDLLSTQTGSMFVLSFVFRGGVTIENVEDCAKKHSLEWIAPENGDSEGVYVFRRSQ